MQIDFSKTLISAVIVLALSALVWRGVLHADALLAVVGLLIPSPIARKEPTP